MKIWLDIKRYWTNVYLFPKFFSPLLLFKEMIKFPVDYFLRDGKSSSILNINLVMTLECNLKCEMCYNHDRTDKIKDYLDLNTVKKLLSELKGKKAIFFLTGGEPFLNKDIFKIIKAIKENGHHCGVCTNTTLLNKESLSKLIQLKLDTLIISLHGYDDTHNKITGNKNSFKKIINNLKILDNFNKKPYTAINFVVSEKNLNNSEKLITKLNSFKLDSIRLDHLNFLTKNDFKKYKLFFKKNFPNEQFEIRNYISNLNYSNIPNKISKLKKLILNNKIFFIFKPNLNNKELINWYSGNGITRKCHFMWRALFIQPNGEIYPCEHMSIKMGNIKYQNMWDIWNNPKYQKIRKLTKKEIFPICKRCCKL